MVSVLNLIRWKNLLMIGLVQCLIKYALLQPFGVPMTLTSFEFALLIIATVLIAAAGYVINDIYDLEADKINKPESVIVGQSVSEKSAYNLYIILNVLGVGIGFYLSQAIHTSGLFSIFIIISVLLYVYATHLKRTFLLGNIVISLLVALSILIVGLFELIPAMTTQNKAIQVVFFRVLLDYALFAFMLNVLREMIKDIEDVDGDYTMQMKTMPIVLGRERALKILFMVSIITLLLVLYYIESTLYKQPLAVVYFLVLIVAPFLYTIIEIVRAKTKKNFRAISNLFKLIMISGMLSLVLYKFLLLQ